MHAPIHLSAPQTALQPLPAVQQRRARDPAGAPRPSFHIGRIEEVLPQPLPMLREDRQVFHRQVQKPDGAHEEFNR